jgi:hypothetical protein
MKTIALLALLTIGLVTAAGCHWGHNRDRNHYLGGYYRR